MSFDLSVIATIVDVIAAALSLMAMQTIARLDSVPRVGLIHLQRLAFGILAICLMWNALANPQVAFFGEHHLSGFMIDCAVMFVVGVYVLRGTIIRQARPHERVETIKQPIDYIRDFVRNWFDNGRSHG